MKTALERIDDYVFNAIRLGISALVILLVATHERSRGILPSLTLKRHSIVIYAIAVGAVYQLLFLLGISRTTSGNTALIISTVPVWTALAARIFIHERLHQMAWCGLFIALTGTMIVAFQKGNVTTESQHLAGNLMVLAAAMTWAGGTVYSRPLLRQISPAQLSAAAALIALPLHILVAGNRYGESAAALQSSEVWLIILYAGVLSSGLALPMWAYGVRHAGAAPAAVMQNLIPLIAILATWVSRGEAASNEQLAGGALILCGLVMMRWKRDAC